MKAFVYNPLETMTLLMNGREYVFPSHDITVIEDQQFSAPDMYRRHHPSQPEANAMLETTMSGMEAARWMLTRQYLNLLDAGFILSEKEITPRQKEEAYIKALAYKKRVVDEALQERRERQSGGHGRLAHDEKTIAYMAELGIEDPIYNPDVATERLAGTLATAIAKGVAEAMQNQGQNTPVKR